MKKLVMVLVVLFVTGNAQAGIDQSTNNSSASKAKQKQAQGQLQGQVGINKAVGTGNETSTTINEGDTDVIAPSWASSPSTSGKDEKSVYSLWGGINNNELSVDKKLDWYKDVVEGLYRAEVINKEEYQKELRRIFKTARSYVRGGKVLGVLPVGCKNPILSTVACF